MTPTQEQFYDKCPAFARQAGITNLRLWEIAESIVPFSWSQRFDKLDEMEIGFNIISYKEKKLLVKVLQAWDSMVA